MVLRSTAELVEVQVSSNGEKFWAKRSDLAELISDPDKTAVSRKKQSMSTSGAARRFFRAGGTTQRKERKFDERTGNGEVV